MILRMLVGVFFVLHAYKKATSPEFWFSKRFLVSVSYEPLKTKVTPDGTLVDHIFWLTKCCS